MKRILAIMTAAVLLVGSLLSVPAMAETADSIYPEWFGASDISRWWATESYRETGDSVWEITNNAGSWMSHVNTQFNNAYAERYWHTINLNAQTSLFFKGYSDANVSDVVLMIDTGTGADNHAEIAVGSAGAGSFDTCFNLSENTSLRDLADASGNITVIGMYFNWMGDTGSKLRVERFIFGSGSSYSASDSALKTVNWFDASEAVECWFNWDWNQQQAGNRFSITVSEAQPRFAISADANGWHYTPNTKDGDYGVAESYGNGTGISLQLNPNVFVAYTAPCNSSLRLRIYAINDAGSVYGDPQTIAIGALSAGANTLSVDLSKLTAVQALANSAGWLYVSGVSFTTDKMAAGDTMTFSDMYFAGLKTDGGLKLGDFNSDNARDGSDINLLKSTWLNKGTLSAISDFNGDGATDICDAVLLQMALNGQQKPADDAAESTAPDESNYTTYYIDSANGSDGYSGMSESKPWRTFSKLNITDFQPGTRILIKRGSVFTSPLVICAEGNENGYIVIDAYGEGAKPIINAGSSTYGVYIKNSQYIEVRNLEVTCTAEYNARRFGVYVNVGGSDTDGGVFRHTVLKNIDVHDVSSTEGDRWTGGIVFVSNVAANPTCFDDILVEGCTISDTPGNGITITSDYNNRNGVTWGQRDYFPSTNVTFRNNVITNAAGDGIFFNCVKGGLLEYNVVSGCCWANGAFAGMWPHNSTNVVMQYNEAYDTKLVGADGQGYDIDINCYNCIAQYNYSHDNEGGFILICTDGTDLTAFNTNAIVRYNVSQNDKSRIFTLSGPIDNAQIYNNTVYVKSSLATNLIGSYDWGTNASPQAVTISNNIFNIGSGSSNSLRDASQVTFKNNIAYGGYTYGLSSDKSNKINTNPRFSGAGSAAYGLDSVYGYKLKSNSPCINAGLLIEDSGFADYAGNWLLTDGMPDIGAFEYVS